MKRLYLAGFLIAILCSCQGLEEIQDSPVAVESTSFTKSDTLAIFYGKILSAGDGIKQYGHIWTIDGSDPVYSNTATLATRQITSNEVLNDSIKFESEISLEKETTYKVRPYAVDIYGSPPYYGQNITFVTEDVTIARFSIGSTDCFAPCGVEFNNESLNATTVEWIFSDGGTSDLTNPYHVYKKSGRYEVKLIASGPGGTDTLVKTLKINGSTFKKQIDFNDVNFWKVLGQDPVDYPIYCTSDGSYIVAFRYFDTFGNDIYKMNKYIGSGDRDFSFNVFEFGFNWVDMIEYNTDFIGLSGKSGPCGNSVQYIDNETGEPHMNEIYGYQVLKSEDTKCVKIFAEIIYEGIGPQIVRICTATGNSEDPNASEATLLISYFQDWLGSHCGGSPMTGLRETILDATQVNTFGTPTFYGVGLSNGDELTLFRFEGLYKEIYRLNLFGYTPLRIKELPSGELIIVGRKGNDVFIIKSDREEVKNEFLLTNINPKDVIIEDDGSIVVVSLFGSLIKYSPEELNFAYAKKWENTDNDLLGGSIQSIKSTNDGGYIMLTTNNPFGSGSTKMFLVKLDFEGRLI